MNHIVTTLASKKLQHAFGAEDPYYSVVEEQDTHGQIVTRKIKKEMPAGISQHDEKILKSVKRRAYYLELFFGLCGFNCGWTIITGLIPFVGWAINIYLGLLTIRKAEQIEGGLTNWQRSHMMGNLMADAGLGFFPVVGDVVAAIYKSNTRNAAALEKILKERGEKNLRDQNKTIPHTNQFIVDDSAVTTSPLKAHGH